MKKQNFQIPKQYNFTLKEFTYSAEYGGYLDITQDQFDIIMKLVSYLMQPIRDKVKVPVTISSGIRNWELILLLRQRGYPASTTSDHLIPSKVINKQEFKELFHDDIREYKLFASKKLNIENPFGSGACDFEVPSYNGYQMFDLFKQLKKELWGKYNQIIFYPESKSKFIHVALKRGIVFPFNIDSRNPVCIYMNKKYYSYDSSLDKRIERLLG